MAGDVNWDSHSTLLYPGLCTFAGVCAGVFGVGGGIIKGPLMLEMGVLPDVAARCAPAAASKARESDCAHGVCLHAVARPRPTARQRSPSPSTFDPTPLLRSTSTTMIFFTSLAASVVFVSFGAIRWDYGVIFLALGLAFTTAGQLLTFALKRRSSGRTNLIVVIMALVLGLSAVALAVQGVLLTIDAEQSASLWDWGKICTSGVEPPKNNSG